MSPTTDRSNALQLTRRYAVLGPIFMATGQCGIAAVPLAPGQDDPVTRARLHGQRLVRMARALKSA